MKSRRFSPFLSLILVSLVLLLNIEASFTKFDPALENAWFDADWAGASFIVKDITTYPTTYSENDLTTGLMWLDESTQDTTKSSVKLSAERLPGESSHRSEFRFHPEFRATPATTGETVYNRLSFQAYLSETTRSEYTFAQIHIKSTSTTRPPIRITYNLSQKDSEGKSYTNYFFLNYNTPKLTSDGSDATLKYALMAHTGATQLYDFHLVLTNGVLTVTINDTEVFSQTLDSNWTAVGQTLYFKTGVYCSGSGTVGGDASIEYLQLERVIGSSTVIPLPDWTSTAENPTEDPVDETDDGNSASAPQFGLFALFMLFFFQ